MLLYLHLLYYYLLHLVLSGGFSVLIHQNTLILTFFILRYFYICAPVCQSGCYSFLLRSSYIFTTPSTFVKTLSFIVSITVMIVLLFVSATHIRLSLTIKGVLIFFSSAFSKAFSSFFISSSFRLIFLF